MNILDRIITPPKQVGFLGGDDVVLATAGRCLCRLERNCDSELALTAESKLRQALSDTAGPSGGSLPIILELGAAPEGMPNADQGYRLTVGTDGVRITGFGDRGLLYGAVTLCQMLEMQGGKITLPQLEITDWPDLEKRGHFIESRYGTNLMELEDWKSIIDDLVEKKQNIMSMSLYGCWGMQYDGEVCEYVYFSLSKYPKLKTTVNTKYYSVKNRCWTDKREATPIAEQDFLLELCKYAKQNGVELVPLINSYGHNTLIPRMYPEVSAKFPDGSPTYNGYCTSSDATYELLFDIYDAIIDRYLKPCGFESFDIGMDEIDDQSGVIGVYPDDPFSARPAFCECEKCRDVPNYLKFVDHAVKLASHLKQKGMKNVYVCNDMFFRSFDPKRDFYLTPILDAQRAASGDTSITAAMDNHLALFWGELKKHGLQDTIVMNWWKYTDIRERMSFTPEDISSSRLRSIVKPMNGYYHWNVLRHAVINSHILAQVASAAEGCTGYVSYSSWDRMFDRTNSAQAAFTWGLEQARDPGHQLQNYCKRLFGEYWRQGVRAFELLDLCNREGNEVYENGKKVLDSRMLAERTLAYYLFSYIAKDKPYPRNFPGESMQTILQNRDEHQRLMLQVSASAKQASKLFSLCAQSPNPCGRYYALRYQLEADNFAVLCDDWLALLTMHDMCASRQADAASEIKLLAAERKNARLQLMERIETLKEHYLHSSHLRNQSIFMQLFADIENYAAGGDVFALDFCDLRPIASARLNNLR
ncbi:MAG: family 20 glycosylhydrolase [Clostridia bacterium]|nr:family 20 glycosylhydrolase [Clostridia bacterium]